MYYRKDTVIQNAMGEALPGAALFVCSQPADFDSIPPRPLAEVWREPHGCEWSVTQPLISDGTGHFFYYAPSGFYTEVYFYRGQLYKVLPDQMVGLPE